MKIIKTDTYFNHPKSYYMPANPKENRTRIDHILVEQFLRKGYRCEEICEENSTIFVITHEKKNTDTISQSANEMYKDLARKN